MPQTSYNKFWIISLTCAVALLLAMMPLPAWARPWRPEWVLLVLIYWTMALPHSVGVGVGWLLGLFVDVAHNDLLGLHALSYAVTAYIVLQIHQRVRVFPLRQQAIVMGFILLPFTLITLWVNGIRGQSLPTLAYWGPVLTGMLLWPWVFILLRKIRRGADLS